MKKILALMLAIIMLAATLSLVSCDIEELFGKAQDGMSKDGEELNGKTPEELYTQALASVSGKDNYTLVGTQVITMTVNGQKMVVNQSITSMTDGRNVYVKTENDSMSSAEIEVWYVDETYYAIQGTTKFKANISYEDYVEKYMPEGSTSEGALINIPKSWFKDTRFYKDGDSYYLEFIVSGEEYTKYFDDAGLSGVDVEDASYKVYFDENGELGDIVTVVDYEVSGVKAHAVSTSKISKIGGTAITAPEGAENWMDMTGRI